MKAIIIEEPGGVDKLIYTDLPVPVIGEGEVLVQVKAISINPVDVKTRAGKGVYGRIKQESPIIIGWDISGIVKEAAPGGPFNPGDEVFGMVRFPGHGKAYAEYVAVPAAHLALKPKGVSFEAAAATTLAALTAYQGLVKQAQIAPGKRLLIHAAAGGVGHFVVQMAKHLGLYVIGTASAQNRDFVMELGADEFIDYKTQRFEEVAKDVDLVFDTIGGDNIVRSIAVVKKGGSLISIPTGIVDTTVEQAKQADVHAYFFLVQSSGTDMAVLADWLATSIIKPHVTTYPFAQMAEAHLQQETGKTKGKIVLSL